MRRTTCDRAGLFIFLSGIACVLASTALGFYLASRTPDHIETPDWHSGGYDSEMAKIGRIYAFLWDVQVIMWLIFGVGVTLTLVGLRMLTRPRLDFVPSKPLGSVRDVFEDPV